MEISSLIELPSRYEDQESLDFALETMPLQELFMTAEKAHEADASWGFEDHLVMTMLKWFKQWFKWVNNAPCEKCGSEKTTLKANAEATGDERRFGAGRVEVYACADCGHDTRFPRYNDPVKLLQTRQGRCGEWANVCTLLLRSLGLNVRYIWNAEDHVWNEVYSEKQDRWVHVDSCEEAFDKPLTYTDGWGKKMSYVIGFSTSGAKDVTKRYVRREDMQLPRTRFDEDQLKSILQNGTLMLRDRLEPTEQVLWFERENSEDKELASYSPSQTSTELPRQSGSKEWVEQRGEGGN